MVVLPLLELHPEKFYWDWVWYVLQERLVLSLLLDEEFSESLEPKNLLTEGLLGASD